MFSPLSEKWRALAWILMAASCTCSKAQLANTDWNVATLDRILGQVQPGQKLIRVGDMQILTTRLQRWRDQLAGAPQPLVAFDGVAPLWTGGNIYYSFDVSVSAAKQKAFLDAAAEWAMFAALHFIPHTSQANFVTVLEDPSLAGGLSAVGMVGGEQLYQIGPDAWNRSTLCHELGHTLLSGAGFVVTNLRSDSHPRRIPPKCH